MIVALVALFIAADGPAFAVHQINGRLLKNRSVSGTKLKPRSVPVNRLKPGAVVPDARKVGGLALPQLVNGGSSFHGGCDPDESDATVAPCRTLAIGQPAKSNVLVIATGEWFGTDEARGTCSLDTGTTLRTDRPVFVRLGQSEPVHTSEATGSGFSLTYVFDAVPAGTATFSLFCTQDTTADIRFANAKLTAVRLTG